jgi:hypothetical protein
MSVSKINGQTILASGVTITNNELGNATFYIPFVSVTSGTDNLEIDSSGLTYNAFTNTLTLGAAGVGTLNGIATQVQTISTATNANFYPTFVDNNNGTATGEIVYTDAGLSYNPSTNLLSTTVTIAQTVNTVSQATTGTYYPTFVLDNNGSATAESVFTDAGLSYNPATNILTTTVTNGGGYAVRGALATISTTPTQAVNYYIGGNAINALSGTQQSRRIYIPKAGTITSVYGHFQQTASGSGNLGTLAVNVNNGSYTTISTAAHNVNPTVYSNTGLSISVAAGDYIEFRWTCPATTAPTNVNAEVIAYIS